MQRARTHAIGLALQLSVVVHGRSGQVLRGTHTSLSLLDYVPSLVRQVMVLAGAQMDLIALGIG